MLFLVLAASPFVAVAQGALGTAITYQGRLDDGGAPANGSFDFEFGVFESATTGPQLASVILTGGVPVTNGVVSVVVDFGPGIFNGQPRWIEVGVRPGGSVGSFTTLSPRQAVSPAPYALFAGGAAAPGIVGSLPSGALSGVYSGPVSLTNPGNVFSGNAAGLINVDATKLKGTVPDGNLSPDLARRAGGNAFSGTQTVVGGSIGFGTTAPAALLQLESTAQFTERLRLSGQEFYTPLFSSPDGVSLLLGVNRDGNRQLWIGDSAQLAVNDTNPVLRLFPGGRIDAVATDGKTPLPLYLGGGNAMAIDPAGNVKIATGDDYASLASRVIAIRGSPTAAKFPGTSGLVMDNPVTASQWTVSTFTTGDLGIFKTGGGAANVQVLGEVTMTACNITSDRNAKEGFKPINPREILDKVSRLPISEWQYKTRDTARHMGPMAQDFREAFALGGDEKHITTVDADGVALAAIQGLNEKLEEKLILKEAEIGHLESENQRLAGRLAAIERLLGLSGSTATTGK